MDTKDVLGIEYTPRIQDSTLHDALLTAGAVVIEGPRACGKTMTGMNAAESYAFLDDTATQELLHISPKAILEGDAPRLLDEWQTTPDLWNMVRRAVDRSSPPGRYILTASALPADDITRHTGAGRFMRIRQYTMSWQECGLSTGQISLKSLFEGQPINRSEKRTEYETIIANLLSSGFPALNRLDTKKQHNLLRAYLEELIHTDLPRLANIRHHPAVLKQLMKALARSVSTQVSFSTLTADIERIAPQIKTDTVSEYINLLQRLFILDYQYPWAGMLRSRARLRTSPKIHLADTALAAIALGGNRQNLFNDTKTTGFLFENAVFHDLQVYAGPLGGASITLSRF